MLQEFGTNWNFTFRCNKREFSFSSFDEGNKGKCVDIIDSRLYEEKFDFLIFLASTGSQERLIFIRSSVQLSRALNLCCVGCDCEKAAFQIIKYLGYIHTHA